MTTNITLVVVVGVLVACGVTLLLERSLTRILVGFVLIGNAINVLFLIASGEPGAPPVIGSSSGRMSDPLPQAMALTAIVITLGVAAFGLALAYRSWQLFGHDDVQDDLEDDLVRRRAERDDTSSTFDHGEDVGVPDEEGADPADLPAGERSPGESDAATDADVGSGGSDAHDHSLDPGGGAGPRAAERTGGGAGPRAAEGTGGDDGPRAAESTGGGAGPRAAEGTGDRS